MRARDLLLAVAALGIGFVVASTADTPPAHGQDAAATIDDMDLDFLREKMLKIWIIEEASDRHNRRRIAEKSFNGMTPYEPTGDAALDAENKAQYLKNDKHLRHYLMLELDNAIEVIDICQRVLGRHVRPPRSSQGNMRKLLEKQLPALNWSDMPLAEALHELGNAVDTPVTFSGLAPNEDARIDIEFPEGFMLQQAIEFIQGIHPLAYRLEDGVLHFEYGGD